LPTRNQKRLALPIPADKGGSARLLLGEIQLAQGRTLDARKTWQKLVDDLPSDPSAGAAKRKLEANPGAPGKTPDGSNVPLPRVPYVADIPIVNADPSWLPPDVDNVPPIAQDDSCSANDVVDRAFALQTQLANFDSPPPSTLSIRKSIAATPANENHRILLHCLRHSLSRRFFLS
jgi:hypothetical protein